jgi:hypothetical protein
MQAASSMLNARARVINSLGSEISAGEILLATSAPMFNIWMTPLASVAMLEKFSLLKMASCSAPAPRQRLVGLP